MQEAAVVGAEARRHAAVEKRAPQVDPVDRRALVPRVSCPVAVDVASVVGVPRVGRKDDGDTISAQPAWADDEHRPASPPAVAEFERVDARWPRADFDRDLPRRSGAKAGDDRA